MPAVAVAPPRALPPAATTPKPAPPQSALQPAPKPAAAPAPDPSDVNSQIVNDPLVKRAVELFNGKIVHIEPWTR